MAPLLEVRPLEKDDRAAVEQILGRAGNFSAVEISTAMELVDEWLSRGEASGYLTYVVDAQRHSRPPVGYVCFGPTPLTASTYDLYWIAVDPAAQGLGYGRALLEFAERSVLERSGRLLLIETSSEETYGATVKFYEGAGYKLTARIREYYKVGDDKLVFAKWFVTI